MIDTHTHLYFPEYGDEIEIVMNSCRENGINHFILPNVDEESISQMKGFHYRYPYTTSMAIGLHPTEVKEDANRVIDVIEEELNSGSYVGVGEIGMDLYWDQSYISKQKESFARQLKLAEKYSLPVIIHSRNAFEETMEVVEKIRPDVPLIFHSFTGSTENVKRIRKGCDPFFGINGVVTYKNAPELREALKPIGLSKIVLETDAPFLTPVPHRGKRNDSSYLSFIRDKIAESLGCTPQEVETVTDSNARQIFNI